MSDCENEEHLHTKIKEFKLYRNKNATPKEKAFAVMYSRLIDFPDHVHNYKKIASPCFLSDLSNIFFDSYKVIHVTRHIRGYTHNFCNKKVRELTEKNGQYFSCIFHNGFRFDMMFLTKGLWLSLWRTKDVILLGSGLTTLKAYNIGGHVKFIDSTKYHQ